MSILYKFLLVIAIGIITAVLMAWPVQLLWNMLMPEIFALKTISFWQAWGLGTLCSILFKSSDTSKSKDK